MSVNASKAGGSERVLGLNRAGQAPGSSIQIQCVIGPGAVPTSDSDCMRDCSEQDSDITKNFSANKEGSSLSAVEPESNREE